MAFGWTKGFTLPGSADMTLYQRLEMCLQHKVHKNSCGEATVWHYIESDSRPRQQFKVMRDRDHALIVSLYDTSILWLLNDGTTLLTCDAEWLDTHYTRATFGEFGFSIFKEGNDYALRTQRGSVKYYEGMRVSKGTRQDLPILQSPAMPFTKAVANREVNKQVRAWLKPVYEVIDMLVLANTGQDLWKMRNMHHGLRRHMHEHIMGAVRTEDWNELSAFVEKHAVELTELAIHGVDNIWNMTDPKEMRAAIRKSLHERFKTTKTTEYFLHDR